MNRSIYLLCILVVVLATPPRHLRDHNDDDSSDDSSDNQDNRDSSSDNRDNSRDSHDKDTLDDSFWDAIHVVTPVEEPRIFKVPRDTSEDHQDGIVENREEVTTHVVEDPSIVEVPSMAPVPLVITSSPVPVGSDEVSRKKAKVADEDGNRDTLSSAATIGVIGIGFVLTAAFAGFTLRRFINFQERSNSKNVESNQPSHYKSIIIVSSDRDSTTSDRSSDSREPSEVQYYKAVRKTKTSRHSKASSRST